MLLHQIGLHLLVSNFVLLQINKIVHQVWKLLDMFGHYRLQGANPHEAQSFLQAIPSTENHQAQYMQFQQMYVSMFGLWSGLETDDEGKFFESSQYRTLTLLDRPIGHHQFDPLDA